MARRGLRWYWRAGLGCAALLLLAFVSAPFWIEWLLRAITFAPAAPVDLLPARIVAEFPEAQPELFESIAVDEAGRFYVTLLTRGEIWRVAPTGERSVFSTIPAGPFRKRDFDGFVGALARAPNGDLFVTVGARDRAKRGVWRVPSDGEAELFAPLGGDVWPNGITFGPAGELYVADSAAPRIWRIDRSHREAELWSTHALLERTGSQWLPGVNGVQFFEGAVFASNTSAGHIVRIPVLPNGSAGPPEVYVAGVSADDFAFDAGGDLYLTTHPLNSVLRVTPDRALTVVATAAQGAVGPTSAVVARDEDGREALYVLNDGGFLIPTHRGTPNILELAIRAGSH